MEYQRRNSPELPSEDFEPSKYAPKSTSWFVPVFIITIFFFPPLVVPLLLFVLPILLFSSKKPIEITSYGKQGEHTTWELRPKEDDNSGQLSVKSLEGIRERHNEAKKTIASYSMDITKALNYPAFNDPTEPRNQEMLKSLAYADDMYAVAHNDLNTHTMRVYSEAVTELTYKLQVAEHHAQYAEWKALDSTTQKYFERADSLYRHAFDPGNPKQLRIEYMNRLKDTIEKINKHSRSRVIPVSIDHSIDRALQRELE